MTTKWRFLDLVICFNYFEKKSIFWLTILLKHLTIDDIAGDAQHTTACMNCNFTCHFVCQCEIYSSARNKMACVAMDSDGMCQLCPGKCHWHYHRVSFVPFGLKSWRMSPNCIDLICAEYPICLCSQATWYYKTSYRPEDEIWQVHSDLHERQESRSFHWNTKEIRTSS